MEKDGFSPPGSAYSLAAPALPIGCNAMITTRVTLRSATWLAVCCSLAIVTPAAAERPETLEADRVVTEHAMPVARQTGRAVVRRDTRQGSSNPRRAQASRPRPTNRLRSPVAQAAHGQVLADPPQPPLDGSLASSSGRGSVTRQVGFLEDYGHQCGPVCDCDGDTSGEIVCGVEPFCGTEVVEPGYGYEPVCGMEPGCGLESCAQCRSEPFCGSESLVVSGPSCGGERPADCSCDACASACEIDRLPLFLPVLRVNWCRFDFFAGVNGFKGPMNFAATDADDPNDRTGSGSFGFYQGFNEGRSLGRWLGVDLAAQLGLRATQSNLSGAEFTDETHHQIFLTGGFFRRVDYGLQYGLVVDYLNEDWYFQGDLTQLRGELSWRTRACHEFGFQFMAGNGSDSSSTTVRDASGALVRSSVSFEPTDQYRFFFRTPLRNRGSWSVFGGWTDNDQGLLGTNLDLPLLQRLGLQTGFTYLIPDELGRVEHRSEAWNVSLGLVFRPGGPRPKNRYARPLFNVADNGTFLVTRN